MAFTFQNLEINFALKKKSSIKQWLEQVVLAEKKRVGSINFLFATDEFVLDQNKRFLKHNTYTDIITFHNNEGACLNGDILISIDRVKENAATLDIPFQEELRRVMVHGVLHLCGFKDKSPEDIKKMRAKENKALKLYLSLFK
jgi:probable rRNA maturation factor